MYPSSSFVSRIVLTYVKHVFTKLPSIKDANTPSENPVSRMQSLFNRRVDVSAPLAPRLPILSIIPRGEALQRNLKAQHYTAAIFVLPR